MAYVESTVRHNGVDITNQVLDYERTVKVCTGIGTLNIRVLDSGRNYDPWDEIDIYEFGGRVGRFLIISDERRSDGSRELSCQDYSKRLSDYFIDRTYILDAVTYSVYWIDLICNLAGMDVEYAPNLGDGEIVAPSTSFGFATAYDDIMRLLQMNGWFMFVDNNGTLQIDIINRPLNHVDSTINNDEVLDFESKFDDAMLRNRAVVWGNANPLTGLQVFVDIRQPSPYLYDARDERSVAMGNSHIYDYAKATEIAMMMLTEFNRPTFVKKFTILNTDNIFVGDIVRSSCNYWQGRGRVTTIVSNLSSNGLITTIYLDERCPRLFTYFGPLTIIDGVDVWVGTKEAGLWHGFVSSGYAYWYDDSLNLENPSILDLFINNTKMVTIAGSDAYQKGTEGYAWNKVITPVFTDLQGITYSGLAVSGVAVSMRPLVGTTVVAYNYAPSGETISGIPTEGLIRSWVVELDSTNQVIRAEPVVVIEPSTGDLNEFITVIDIEALDDYNVVSGLKAFNREFFYWWTQTRQWESFKTQARNMYSFSSLYNTVKYWGGIDMNTFNGGPQENFTIDNGVNAILHSGVGAVIGYLLDDDHVAWAVNGSIHLQGYNMAVLPPVIAYDYDLIDISGSIFMKKNGTSFDFFGAGIDDLTYGDNKLHISHWTYTLGGAAPVQVTDTSYTLTHDNSGTVIVGMGFWDDVMIVLVQSESGGNRSLQLYRYYVSSQSGFLEDLFAKDIGIGTGPEGLYEGEGWYPFFAPTGGGVFVGAIHTEGYNFSSVRYLLVQGGYVSQSGNLINIPRTLVKEILPDPGHNQVQYEMTTTTGYALGATAQGSTAYITWEYEVNSSDSHTGVPPALDHNVVITVSCNDGAIGVAGFNEIIFDAGDTYLDPSLLHWRHNDVIYNNAVPAVADVKAVSARSNFSPCIVANLWKGGQAGPPTDLTVVLINVIGLSTVTRSVGTFDDTTPTGGGDDSNVVALEMIDDISGLIYLAKKDSSIYAVRGTSLQTYAEIIYSLSFPPTGLMSDLVVGPKVICRPGMVFDLLEPIVMRHTSAIALSGYYATTAESVMEQTIGTFEVIHRPPVPVKVEISKGAPTIIYTADVLSYDPYLAGSLYNGVNSFYESVVVPTTLDVRVFDLFDPQIFPTVSGTLSGESFERFVGIADGSGFLAQPFTMLGEWIYLATSGGVSRIETTNYTFPNPWLFYSISGATVSGISPSGISYSGGRFFARNPLYGWWDVSYGLPNSDITIIRTDDIV